MSKSHVVYKGDKQGDETGKVYKKIVRHLKQHDQSTWPTELQESIKKLGDPPKSRQGRDDFDSKVEKLIYRWIENNEEVAKHWRP
ncbi:MAG: hypothetical protein WCF94_00220 [bacterium]